MIRRKLLMRTQLSRIVALLSVAVTGGACGGDNGSGTGPPPETPVLTTLELTPATATLFTIAPGQAITLSVVAKDQDGQTMAGAGSASFSSDNAAIAAVSEAGTITALGAGTTRITASLTAGAVTKTATTTVTALVAPAYAGVVAPGIEFLAATVDVQAGGTVNWAFASIPHDVTFTTAGAPADVPALQDGSASRTFPSNGSFAYRCSIHPPMTGVVHVH